MGTSTQIDAVLRACHWMASPEEVLLCQPALCAQLPSMTEVSLGRERFEGIPVVFSQELEGPLSAFIEAALDTANGRKASMGEAPARLEGCLVALLTECPIAPLACTQAILLELVRQSSALFAGQICQERLGLALKRLGSMSSSEQGENRRWVVRRLTTSLSSAMSEACAIRPGLHPTALHQQLVACPLVFSHSASHRQGLDDVILVGAELGIEVDGQLLESLNRAVEEGIRLQMKGSDALSLRLQARFAEHEIRVAALVPEDLQGILSSIQKNLRVKDLVRCGVEKTRAKNLLRMKSTGVFFEIYRQLHLQLRRYDVLAGLASRVLPIRLGSGGGFTPFGPVDRQVRWEFIRPRLQIAASEFSVVCLQMEALIGAATKRALRDESTKSLAAVWGLWESLIQEVESVGGMASLRGGTGVAVFFAEEEAEAFARSAKTQLKLPITLHHGSDETPIILTGVVVDVERSRGPVHGACFGEQVWVWGPLFEAQKALPTEAAQAGFSILTEVGEPEETDLRTSETFIDEDFQVVDGSQEFTEEAESTLDGFFLPSRHLANKQARGVSIGLELGDLESIFKGYGHYADAAGGWVFGKPGEGGVLDRHVYPGGIPVLDALCAFLLDKYKEGFAPRSDLFAPLPMGAELEELSKEALGLALEALERGKE